MNRLLGELRRRLTSRHPLAFTFAPIIVVGGPVAGIFGWIKPFSRALIVVLALYSLGVTAGLIAAMYARRTNDRSGSAFSNLSPGKATNLTRIPQEYVDRLDYCASLIASVKVLPDDDLELAANIVEVRTTAEFAAIEQEWRDALGFIIPNAPTRRYAIYYGSSKALQVFCKDNWVGTQPPELDERQPPAPGLKSSHSLIARLLASYPGLLIEDLNHPARVDREIARMITEHLDGGKFSFFGWYPLTVYADRYEATSGSGRTVGALLVQCASADAIEWAGGIDRTISTLTSLITAALVCRIQPLHTKNRT